MTARRFDLVLLGASGYTGALVAAELAAAAASEGIRWAIAGRDRGKLEATRAALRGAGDVPILIADARDVASLERLAGETRVIASTVGPYRLYGSELVGACARAGTSYCDLTGEVPWMRAMIDAHDATARASGARIVFTCGFDSIPSDVGVWLAHRALAARGRQIARATGIFELRGGASGGTIASMLDLAAQATKDAAFRAVLRDRDALVPGAPRSPKPPRGAAVGKSPLGGYTAPFVMAVINTRVVRRTNVLLELPYGPEFTYTEAMATGDGFAGWRRAGLVVAGLGAFAAGAGIAPIAKLIAGRLPKPGEGPTSEERARGRFRARILGEAAGEPSARVIATIADHFDPGYGSTSRMFAQAALALARGEGDPRGGCTTPVAALGDGLVGRLRAIGLELSVADA